ncbi:Imm8 family immunity protein [Achromobacter seleniivolatilans]|uniref:Imm8 family immunity protein n=1 Tax=Achromobacter seleniivolatilans TaxID=3047478 RepID=UPI003528EEEA
MRAQLREISSDEVDVRDYSANLPDAFCITLRLRIGVEDAIGADNFEVCVCNFKWLESHAHTPFSGAGFLIVRDYDFEEIELTVLELISKCGGTDWNSIGNKLSRYFLWEFVEYKP